MFLGINATADDGMNAVAKRYGLVNEWWDTIKESKEDNHATKFYKLLVLVKTTSKKDNVWISFVDGLHRHAAIVICLTCSDFDLKDNYINQGSLKNKAFKNAAVPHYRNPQRMPIQVLATVSWIAFVTAFCTRIIGMPLMPASQPCHHFGSVTLII